MENVKYVIKQIVKALTHMFIRSLFTGIFPNDMKTAKVIPVLKSRISSVESHKDQSLAQY